MTLKHNFLAASYPFLHVINSAKAYVSKSHKGSLRVLVYHDIPPNKIVSFTEQILWLKKKNWKFIHPDTFSRMLSGEQPIIGNNLLLTFDDGFISNRIVAEKVLKPLKISALFFIVSGFADLTNQQDCHDFISKGIRKDLDPSDMPNHWKNMTWKDLEFLLDNGHIIGAHTASHLKLSKISDKASLEDEIVKSADIISSKLSIDVDHFAFTFGDMDSISHDAYKIALSRFKYIFTSLRGSNTKKDSPALITRDTISPDDNNYLVGSFLEGGADFMYKQAKESLKEFIA